MEETDPDYQRIANHLLDSLQKYPNEVEQEPLLRNQKVIRFLWDQISEKTEILGPHLSPEQKIYTIWHSIWFYYFGYGKPFVLLPPPESTQVFDTSLQEDPEFSQLPPTNFCKNEIPMVEEDINSQATSIIEEIWMAVHTHYNLEKMEIPRKRGLLRKMRFLWRCAFEHVHLECPQYSVGWKVWLSSKSLWENCFEKGKPFFKQEPPRNPTASQLDTKTATLTTTEMFGTADWGSPCLDQLPPRIVKSLVRLIAQAKGESLGKTDPSQNPGSSKLAQHVAKYAHLQSTKQITEHLFSDMGTAQPQHKSQPPSEEEAENARALNHTPTMAKDKHLQTRQTAKRPVDETETLPPQTRSPRTLHKGPKRQRTRISQPDENRYPIHPSLPPPPPPADFRTAHIYKNTVVFNPATSIEPTQTEMSSASESNPARKFDNPPSTATPSPTKTSTKFSTRNWVTVHDLDSPTIDYDGDVEMDTDKPEETTPIPQVEANPFPSQVATLMETPAQKAQRELREEYKIAEAAFWVDLEDSLGN